MTSAPVIGRRTVLAALASPLWLAACGHGSSGSGSIRAINLTDDLASVDLYQSITNVSSASVLFGGLNTGVLSSYATLDANTYTLNVNSAGNATSLFTGNYSIAKDAHYTAVIWGPQASLRINTLPEDDDTTQIASGNTVVRIFNATETTGTLDVYLTSPGASLPSSTPTQAGLTGGSLSGFHQIPAGTYELRVTGTGNPSDIRLDIAAFALSAGQYSTIVLTAGRGGALVNSTLIVEQGAATSTPSLQARIRVAASVDHFGSVTASINDTTYGVQTLATNLITGVSPYTLITVATSTSATYSIQVNGATMFTGPLNVTAGGDYTFLVWGPVNAPQLSQLADNNNLPLAANQASMRLVNGVDNLSSLSLYVNHNPVSQGVGPGQQSSSYALVTVTNSAFIGAFVEVDDAIAGPVFLSSTNQPNGVPLSGPAVYSVFVLSGQSTPKTLLVPEL